MTPLLELPPGLGAARADLVLAQTGGRLPGRLLELARLNVLILDELGYLSLDRHRGRPQRRVTRCH
jgi:hypothetical protein